MKSLVTPLRISCKDVSTRQVIYFIKKILYLVIYLKILPCYSQYSWKRFPSKLWKSYSWLHPKIHPETYWWVASKIIRCYRGPTLNAFGFYRFTSRCNSLALIYITKDFEWSPLSDFEKSANLFFIHAWHFEKLNASVILSDHPDGTWKRSKRLRYSVMQGRNLFLK